MRTTLIAVLVASVAAGQSTDAELTAAIAQIKAIDNHAHPLRYVAVGEKADDEYDALPCDTIEAAGLNPVRLRSDNPELVTAWRGFYGVSQGSDVAAAKKQAI
ncbi:MAG: hypothetical protein HY248_05270, partial [Fimbriimonas ginsengisoli]|nr:hypothetical protein [Fimbriimonas ginsengisoli]